MRKSLMTRSASSVLYPLTAKVVAIGIYDINTNRPYVYYESEEKSLTGRMMKKTTQFRGMSEKEMLERFWEVIKISDQVITFNGRNFDIPFMMMRSAKTWRKSPQKDLMGYRYSITKPR